MLERLFFFAGTGFGTVSKYVIKALLPHFNIDQLAINYSGEFFDSKEWPVQVSPAKLLHNNDAFGNQMFVNALQTGKYDYVWIMNDTFVVEKIAKELPKVFEAMQKARQKIPTIVFYYPVDCQLVPGWLSMLQLADHIVAYCEYGKEKTLKRLPDIKDKLSVITHGVDPSSFRKISEVDRKLSRQQFFKIEDDNTFLWLNVNRNSPRKDLARTMSAFKEFKKQVPNSRLYLHTAIKDTTIDLGTAAEHLGLSLKTDVLFPANYAAHKPFPIEILNTFYNAADAFVTTSLGEGWGLTHLDACLLDIPLVTPDNTCFTEQLASGERGYLYPCKETVYIDNSGYRPYGRLEDITNTMLQCYKDIQSGEVKKKTAAAQEYARSITWNKIGQQWVDLFMKLKTQPKKVAKIVGVKV
jgi:D-inositol-3-phosphate glycosyltransferase